MQAGRRVGAGTQAQLYTACKRSCMPHAYPCAFIRAHQCGCVHMRVCIFGNARRQSQQQRMITAVCQKLLTHTVAAVAAVMLVQQSTTPTNTSWSDQRAACRHNGRVRRIRHTPRRTQTLLH